MSTWYYYNESGEKIEVTGGQLKGLAKAGLITPETIVETEDGKKARAGKVKGLTFPELSVETVLIPDDEKSIVPTTTEESYGVKLPPPKPSPFTAPMPEVRDTSVTAPLETASPFTAPLPVTTEPKPTNPFTASMPVATEPTVPPPTPHASAKPAERPFSATMPTASQKSQQPHSVHAPVADNEEYRKPRNPLPMFIGVGLLILVLIGVGVSCYDGGSSPSATVKRFFTALNKTNENRLVATTTPNVFSEMRSKGIVAKFADGDKLSGYGIGKKGFAVHSDVYFLRDKVKSYSHTIDGDTAEVKVVFKDKTEKSIGLAKVDDKWKISELRELFGSITQSAPRNSVSDTMKRFADEQKAKIDAMQQRGKERAEQERREQEQKRLSLESRIYSVALSPDGKKIVTGGLSNTAKISEIDSGRILQTFEGHAASIKTVSFSPDGKKVVTASDDKTVRIWDTESGKELQKLEVDTKSATFSPDGTKIVTASGDDTVRIWEAGSGRELQKLEGMKFIKSASFSPDGTKIVTASDSVSGTIRIWDTESGKELKKLERISLPNSASFSPDGKKIVAAISSSIRIWDAELSNELYNLEITRSPYTVGNAAFSPDGKKIVTADNEGSVRIWDAESGKELQNFQERVGTLVSSDSVSFSPDGKKIVWIWDNTVKFGDVE